MSPIPQKHPVRILLVDDQPARLLSYEAILADLGHELVPAHSGSEALEKLLQIEFALILLDVNMPGMDGFELAALVHEHPRFEKTPIIFVTGLHVTDFDRLKGYELGAVDYVYVPIVPQILRSKVTVLAELYQKRKDLQDLNRRLEQDNAQLFAANTSLQSQKNRELEQANVELARANSTLQEEIDERRRLENALVETDRRKDEFLAMLAHELRNPLAPILNGVQFMRLRVLDDPELAWSRDMIGRQAEHLTHLVDDLLDVSRITQGKISLQRTQVDLEDVVNRAIETTRHLIEARSHQLAVHLPARPVEVWGDLTRLAQIVGNLLNNAAKFTEEGGSIRIAVETGRGADGAEEALVRVRDSGVGIPPEMLAHVFELFTQVERPIDRSHGGLGIGLALVRRLAELHGGRVEVHSPLPEGGSEFVVALPLHANAELPAARDAQSPGVSRRPAPARVLVVDDNRDSATSMALLLREMGHEVQQAYDGLEGLRAVSAFEPQFVFLDIGMPDLDGYETARRMRALPGGREWTLIALTGFGQDEDRRRSQAAGFDRHLVKPIVRKDLEGVFGLPRAAAPAAEPPAAPAHPSDRQQVAHDLRTPLNALWSTSALLLETTLDPAQREYAGLIRASAESIRRLADDLAGSGGTEPPAAQSPAPEVRGPARALRVLVVDDDPVNRAALLGLLGKLGHSGEAAADGREALVAVERCVFDVVLMDVQMNGLGGLEAARGMQRGQGARACPRILGLTGSARAEEREACRAAGMEAVLEKPIEIETLRAALASGEVLDQRIVASLRSQRTSSRRPALDQLVELYAADTPEQLALLRRASERGDALELARTAHRLKGSSSTVGAKALVALVSRLESLAREGDTPGAAALVADLELAWPVTRDALQAATLRGAAAS